jgi:hypothetical protein
VAATRPKARTEVFFITLSLDWSVDSQGRGLSCAKNVNRL